MTSDELLIQHWKCLETGNPTGTDTTRLGYTCDCQVCRLKSELDETRTKAAARIRELEGRNMMLQQMVDGLVGTDKTHVIVPVEPTPEMIEAGVGDVGTIEPIDLRFAYRAMLRAAQPDAKPKQGE